VAAVNPDIDVYSNDTVVYHTYIYQSIALHVNCTGVG